MENRTQECDRTCRKGLLSLPQKGGAKGQVRPIPVKTATTMPNVDESSTKMLYLFKRTVYSMRLKRFKEYNYARWAKDNHLGFKTNF